MSQANEQKILVVDDLPENLFAMRQSLKDLDAEIFEARSGNEALSLMLRHQFALVLLDVQMPGMDGFEVASIMRGNEDTKHTPIVFVTAISKEDRYQFQGYESGAVDYLFKPIDPEILRSKVRVFLELNRQKHQLREAMGEAETASDVKSRFLANMSHEIRTPLTAILGFGEVALTGDLSFADRQRALTAIVRNGKHLLQVINDILDISKIEAGKLEVETITVDLFEILGDLETAMLGKAQDKGIDFEIDYGLPLPKTIKSDPLRLKQILVNLASNAIKFTDKGGVKVTVECDRATDQIRFEVIDTGVGLSTEQQSKLFAAFTQADSSISRNYGGTGLGLAISRELAARLGGGIDVKSEVGQGSTFTLQVATGPLTGVTMLGAVPDNWREASQVHDSPKTLPKLSGRVLVAEDGEDNQELIKYLLGKIGIDYTIVENGELAVEHARTGQFDLVLMDMQMPIMDGYTATKLLRKKNCTAPIIAVTANAMGEDKDRALKAGCVDFVGKPYSQKSLFSVLQKYLGKASHQGIEVPILPDPMIQEQGVDPDIVLGFLGRLPSRLEECTNAYDRQDWRSLAGLAHRLAGAEMFGYGQLTHVAVALERAAQARRADQIGAAFDEFRSVMERIIAGTEEAKAQLVQ